MTKDLINMKRNNDLIIKNEELVGSKIIEADVESIHSGHYMVIITPNGKKYSISPECEDSQSSTWFDFKEQ